MFNICSCIDFGIFVHTHLYVFVLTTEYVFCIPPLLWWLVFAWATWVTRLAEESLVFFLRPRSRSMILSRTRRAFSGPRCTDASVPGLTTIFFSRMLSRVCSSLKRRPRLAWPCSRYLQAAASQQAFLETLDSRPGISCLSLNRPQNKNAISTTLLQVNYLPLALSYEFIVSYSNSEKALKSSILTRGKNDI